MVIIEYISRVFVRIKGSPTTTRKYLQICKATYNQGRTSHKVVGSLGAIDDLVSSGEVKKLMLSLNEILAKYDSGQAIQENLAPVFRELKRYQWGAVKVIEKLWKIFELDSFLKKQLIGAEFDFKGIVQLLTIDRFMNPRSKLKTYENASRYLGVEDPDLQHIYRSLEILSRLKPNLEKHLFDINRKNFGMNVDIVFFDATTLYFHSDKEDELRKFGFSKDCKFNDVQVVMGLLMDEEGRPIGFQSFPGNTFDGKTLLKALSELKETFQIKKLIIVGDRAMCNRMNLAAVKEAGYEYIVGSSVRKQSAEIKEEILNEEGYRTLVKDESNFKFKEIAVNGERLIVSWSADRARKDAYDRETLVEKAKEVLEGKSKLRKPGKAKYLKLDEEVKYLDEAKIFSDSQWDGFYGILTNVEKDLKSDEEIYDAYHQLWKIEECFRTLKSHLKIRPVYLRKPERIQGHLVLCFLTFVFERHLEIELKKQSKWTTSDRLRTAISDLQASLVEINQKQYLLRSEIDPHAKTILELLKIPTPQDLTLLSEF